MFVETCYCLSHDLLKEKASTSFGNDYLGVYHFMRFDLLNNFYGYKDKKKYLMLKLNTYVYMSM